MPRPTPNTERPDLRPTLRKIQATWSVDQRRHRAEVGRRRMNELYHLIANSDDESEIWAVGAPALDDVRRFAG